MDMIILAGGFGTRLKSLFADIPKPLVKINDTPFLEILINKFIQSEYISKIILATGYKSSIIEDHIKTKYRDLPIEFSIELSPLGTGGAVKKAFSRCQSENILVLNGDSYLDFSLNDMINHHQKNKSDLTIAYTEITNASRFGKLEVCETTQKILAFKEKEALDEKGYINAGIYLFNRYLEKLFPQKDSFSLEKEFFPSLMTNNIQGFFCPNTFIDIGTEESYYNAQKILKNLGN